MLCLDVPPPGVLFDIVEVSLTPHHLHQGDILINIQGAIEAIFLLLLWIIPGIYSSPTKTLSPPHLPTLPCRLVVAQLSANLKCRPPRCYWCDLGTPMISTPSVYQVFYFRFSTCSHMDDHTDWRRPFRQSYGLMRWWFHNEVDIFISWDQTTAKEKRPIPPPPPMI